jgi:hypothetical protein
MDGREGGKAPPMLWLNGNPDERFAVHVWKGADARAAGALHQGERHPGDPQ